MNGDGNYYAENVLKDQPGMTMTYWCSVCSAEPAERSIEVELGEQWVPLMVGNECLSKLPSPEE